MHCSVDDEVIVKKNSIPQTSFSFELKNPNVKITVPEIPFFDLQTHPLASANKPHLRYLGSGGNFHLSILTPTADPGMTPEDCAKSQVQYLGGQYNLQKGQYSLLKSNDGTTYSIYFYLKMGEFYQQNAYLLSGSENKYCVQVHISKMTDDQNDLPLWLKGFPNARIR
ncbi:hypothetical protein EHQ52_15440 [Leptospira koniambonensis]|uniref:DUF1795 domain-containing protein n=1 Tax=Leptospira koniambonensis TaxID=2484950 RepID=A0A4R9J2V8_9LEPT|nr:hypothetical protein [Leptospira koniambonensis]TGL31329.1 hypothetical protein EHQ52_15440 [Leptospira koniambonensis]